MRIDKMSKRKIVFAGHDLKFVKLIIDYLERSNKFEIRIDQWAGHNAHDEQYSKECLNWADVIFCEWGLGNAVWYSKYKLPHQKLIVRMHRQELDTEYPKAFNIENINNIIAISPYVYEEFYRVFKLPREKMTMIYNALDFNSLNKPKNKNSEFNLGIIGIVPKMKRLDLALDVFEQLWNNDNRYKLFIKGKMPQEYSWLWRKEEEKAYYEEQFERIQTAPWKDSVIFEGFGDISDWLKNIGFILSTSDFESFHLAPSEGMASGSIPLILNWDGSETIYKQDYILKDTFEIVDKVEEIQKNKNFQEISVEAQNYVSQLYDINVIGKEVHQLIDKLDKTRCS